MRSETIGQVLGKGELGSTYGGNPVSCAAVSAVLEVFKNENVLGNVAKISKIFS